MKSIQVGGSKVDIEEVANQIFELYPLLSELQEFSHGEVLFDAFSESHPKAWTEHHGMIEHSHFDLDFGDGQVTLLCDPKTSYA